jgi:hypothetical protein
MTNQLKTFFEALSNLVRASAEAQRQLDRELATGFSATRLLQPKELRISDIIACLLDPNDNHGQGDIFLSLLIDMFDINCSTIDDQRIFVYRERANLDVMVEIGSDSSTAFAIGLENKPWAGDGNKQVCRYCTYLEARFPGRWWFGYLSGKGLPPSEQSISRKKREEYELAGRFRTIPFARSVPSPFVRSALSGAMSLTDWFERSAEVCVAERVRWFLRDVANYISHDFESLESETQA